MEILSDNSTCLELSIALPGFSSSSSLQSSGEGGAGAMKVLHLDINQVPLECTEEEYESQNEGPRRKKLRLTKEQSRVLEESFRQNHTLNPKRKEGLSEQLMLKPRQVEVWFQNRRARSKLKQTEMECKYLKKWFRSLSEQNRRLQKEAVQLRGMEVGPPHISQLVPAATVTMCPRCELVSTTFLDKGPATTTSTTPTMSAKVQILHPQHPSAAC